jgi:hypothetical protein
MKPVQGRRVMRLGLLSALSTLILGLTASTALAVVLTPEGPYPPAEVTEVTVTGEAPEAADFVAVAVCNDEFNPGERCDKPSATEGLVPVAEYEEEPVEEAIVIEVRKGNAPFFPSDPWQDWDFTSGTATEVSGSTTRCKAENDEANEQCAVEVSFYEQTKMGPKRLPQEDSVDIFF